MSGSTVNDAGSSSVEGVHGERPSFMFDHGGSSSSDSCITNRPLYARNLSWNADGKAGDISVVPRNGVRSCPRRTPSSAGPPRRRAFQYQLSNSMMNRYYSADDVTQCSPFLSTMKPGVISESLRTALGLSEAELPLYIYRMRCLGYPPGHLEEVCRQRSGIVIFEKNKREVSISGRVLEEGEVDDEENEVIYDLDQLIDYPGFNSEPLPGTMDEHKRLKFPPMLPEHSKEVMRRKMLSQRKRKFLVEKSSHSGRLFEGVADDSCPSHLENVTMFSEEKRNAWLREMGLQAADGWCIVDVVSDDDISQVEPRLHTAASACRAAEHSCHTESLSNLCRVSQEQSYQATETGGSNKVSPKYTERYGGSINVSSGTPIFQKSVCDSKLPDASSFAAGILEPIPYENLPNCTGAFQRMQKILNEARSKT